ncbi:MAG: DUF423 domain-containing protein [Candidatus Kariarchaeaceae archaeon]|jgi:uncharacterized membrane protein YgdD (TMEM256/DUF423 family)
MEYGMNRQWLTVGAVFGGLSVILGAFGTHSLESVLGESLTTYETAAQYQMYHALALLLLSNLDDTVWINRAGYAFVVGILLFCGSLYTLSLTGLSWLGAVAPLGGAAFIVGWACLIMGARS